MVEETPRHAGMLPDERAVIGRFGSCIVTVRPAGIRSETLPASEATIREPAPTIVNQAATPAMTDHLDIHPASADELVAAHKNVFDIWSKGLGLDEHVRYRLNSPSHRRATWFVGCVDGRVVTSLGCYPLRFRMVGRDVPGIAIGSIYTQRESRGRGFAPKLLNWVEDYQHQRGAALSVLYSDIEPSYYARLGYALCPSLEGWRDVRSDLPMPNSTQRLVRVAPADHLAALSKLYEGYHGAAPLSIARDQDYWTAILAKLPDDEFHALQTPDGTWTAYVRIGRRGNDCWILDYALADDSPELAMQLYGALCPLARATGASRVGGWLPESATTKELFELASRRSEITMLKALASQQPLSAEMIHATSRFCEIDHV